MFPKQSKTWPTYIMFAKILEAYSLHSKVLVWKVQILGTSKNISTPEVLRKPMREQCTLKYEISNGNSTASAGWHCSRYEHVSAVAVSVTYAPSTRVYVMSPPNCRHHVHLQYAPNNYYNMIVSGELAVDSEYRQQNVVKQEIT